MKAVAYMLDTGIWNKFAKTDVADYAIGGPTVELLFKAYNAMHEKDKYQAKAESSTGYKISWNKGSTWDTYISSSSDYLKTEKPYVISEKTNAYAMWLASPSAGTSNDVVSVDYTGIVRNYDGYSNYSNGFRPLVCLKSDIHLEKSEDGNYTIVEQQ